MSAVKRMALLAAVGCGAAAAWYSARRPRYSFRGKSVLITGGSRGLGLEVARTFAAEGARICLVGRTAATLESARQELENSGAQVLTVVCDVRDQSQVQQMVQQTLNAFGRIDVLVNNAGVIQVGPFDRMLLEDYENAMATHAWGPLYAMFAVLPGMRRRGSGRIVNVSSIGGKLGVPHLIPYCMSKFALAGLSESIGIEIAKDNVFVTTVYPGLMRTGSHVNASFKGRHRSEFAWFSVAASSPALSMNAHRAARQIVEACRRGQAELILTPQGRIGSVAKALVPAMVSRAMRTTAALMPQPGMELSSESHPGFASTSRWSPSILTVLSDRVVRKNNEGSGSNSESTGRSGFDF